MKWDIISDGFAKKKKKLYIMCGLDVGSVAAIIKIIGQNFNASWVEFKIISI